MSQSDEGFERRGATSGAELLHRMIGGDGEAAMEALLSGFQSRHPDVSLSDVTNENLSLAVKSRILKENPPDVWIEWPGKNLQPYVEANVLADVSAVWTESDMEQQYLDGPRGAAAFDGTYHAVPLNIHRINNLFYNVEMAREAGIDPANAASPREFVEMLREAESETEQVGMLFPMKNPWTVLQLWETVLLGEHGHDVYRAVTDGEAANHRRAIADALDVVAIYADLGTEDALYMSLTDANERFIDGESTFFHQGDWAAGAYTEADGFKYGTDWEHVPFPGTDSTYAMNMDAVVASGSSAEGDAVTAFLQYAGSADGQRRFNQKKGSIPPRTDVSMGEFTEFLQQQHRAFQSSRSQPLSITHGLGVRPDQLIQLKTAMSSFVSTWDTDETASDLIGTFDQ